MIFEIELFLILSPTAAAKTASPYQRKIIFSKNLKDFQKKFKKMSALAILRLYSKIAKLSILSVK